MAKEPDPDAARLAGMPRFSDGAIKADPLDVVHRIVSQQRASLEKGPASWSASTGFVNMPSGISLDTKVDQLAERTSLLLIDLQRHCDGKKADMERQLLQIASGTDTRIARLEAKVASCEEQQKALSDRGGADSGTLKETRSLIGLAVGEFQAQWRAHQSEFVREQEELRNRLDWLARCVQQNSHRLEGLVHLVEEHGSAIRHSEEQMTQVFVADPPPWYGQIEAALVSLEHRLEEHRSATEAYTCRTRMELDAFRHRFDSLQVFRDDIRHMKRDQEGDWRAGNKGFEQMRQEIHASGLQAGAELSRRIDDAEACVTALRVRVDAHDTSFTSLGERVEAICQQAVESASQAALQQREDILSDADRQVRILRERVDALAELCDELVMRRGPVTSDLRRGTSPRRPSNTRALEAEPETCGQPPSPLPFLDSFEMAWRPCATEQVDADVRCALLCST